MERAYKRVKSARSRAVYGGYSRGRASVKARTDRSLSRRADAATRQRVLRARASRNLAYMGQIGIELKYLDTYHAASAIVSSATATGG